MQLRITITFLFVIFFEGYLCGQTCTALGQNPGTAFPVCGTNAFTQLTVPICGQRTMPTPCTQLVGAIYLDKNPYWYKFTCFASGSLGFVITPNNLGDDYDWQLFDVTGHNPDDVYTDLTLFVACNWSGLFGVTGASSSGSGLINCAGNNYPLFSSMPSLVQGHNYLLLISHYSDSQSGYQLSFGGGSAVITDITAPRLQNATINCDGTQLTVRLNKKMKCNSLATNGSDFTISSAVVIASATGNGCSGSFDLDSVTLLLSNPIAPGNYTLTATNGTDGNTLLDNCDQSISQGDNISFTVTSKQPTPMDSITPVACSPASLHLVFKNPIRCNSIAVDGSDFNITGPSTVTVVTATGNCNANGATSTIDVQLSSPIQVGGTYQIHLVNGSDGNTITNECGQQTPAGSTLNFTTKNAVSALFTYQIQYGCHFDTITFSHDGRNGINLWKWTMNGNTLSSQQNFKKTFPASGQYPIQLMVSNGACSDSVTTTIALDNEVKANFETNDIICPEDSATFNNTSTGVINTWLWNFANGITSTQQIPPNQKYPLTGIETYYTVVLTASNGNGCNDTTSRKIRVLKSCFIAVPNAFTPNDDGLNDYLYPLNAFKADNLDFSVYNRWGKLMFKTNDWTKKWNGKIKEEPQPAGVYVWTLRYTHHDTGQKYFLKGTTVLIR